MKLMNAVRRFKTVIVTGVTGTVAMIGSVASAAVPVAASTALTDLSTDGLAMIDLIWPVVAAITIGFVLIRLFKRGVFSV